MVLKYLELDTNLINMYLCLVQNLLLSGYTQEDMTENITYPSFQKLSASETSIEKQDLHKIQDIFLGIIFKRLHITSE